MASAESLSAPVSPGENPKIFSSERGQRPVAASLGLVPYGRAHDLQVHLRDCILRKRLPEVILALEHPPVITLGRRGDPANITVSDETLANLGVEVHQIERGGDVTYHGPGQLVLYPIMRIDRSVRAHVAAMAQAATEVLADLGIEAAWDNDRPGLWVDNRKIAAIGVHVHHGVAIHGLAVNLSTDLSGFDLIVPCGLRDAGVTSVAEQQGRSPNPADLSEVLITRFLEASHRPTAHFLRDFELFSYLHEQDCPFDGEKAADRNGR